MDLITRAIERQLHICGNRKLEEQTWKLFEESGQGKQVFVFGMGGALDYFLRNCCNHMNIAGVLDNDKQKQGQKLGWYCAEAWQTEYEDIVIESPDVLRNFSPQDVLVLITSTNHYQAMIEQLEGMNMVNIFVLLLMEVNARKTIAWEEDFSKIKHDFIDWCCQQEIVKNKIVMSYGEYGGHAKYITRQLLKTRKKLDIVWLVYDENMEAPKGIRLVPMKNWKRYTYEMETAHIWLFDITVLDFIVKREGQVYIQAKHWSSITLKKFYLDDKSSCVSPQIASWIEHNGEMMDYLLSGSRFDEESCRTGFAFKGTPIRVGSARSDVLFEEGIKEKVCNHFRIPMDANIVLYVPTYRKKDVKENCSMQVSLDIKTLQETLSMKFGGEWYILVRLHPWTNFENCNLTESERVKNAGDYQDSMELVAAADVMITDYSSIMFEAAFIKRPVFLYAPDRKDYIEGERGLLLDFNSLPFLIADSNEELRRCIQNFDEQVYEEKLDEFMNRYEVREDGHASERAAQFILSLIGE